MEAHNNARDRTHEFGRITHVTLYGDTRVFIFSKKASRLDDLTGIFWHTALSTERDKLRPREGEVTGLGYSASWQPTWK